MVFLRYEFCSLTNSQPLFVQKLINTACSKGLGARKKVYKFYAKNNKNNNVNPAFFSNNEDIFVQFDMPPNRLGSRMDSNGSH